MTILRALFIASLLTGLAATACGSAGSGGAGGSYTAAPARGTNEPANPPKQYPSGTSNPSSDPYSGYGY